LRFKRGLDAERLQANIDRKLDFAFWLSPRTEWLRFPRGLTFVHFGVPRRHMQMLAGAALSNERVTQALQFDNQRFPLRPDGVDVTPVAPVPLRFAGGSIVFSVPHG
jgi:hypothetical protein